MPSSAFPSNYENTTARPYIGTPARGIGDDRKWAAFVLSPRFPASMFTGPIGSRSLRTPGPRSPGASFLPSFLSFTYVRCRILLYTLALQSKVARQAMNRNAGSSPYTTARVASLCSAIYRPCLHVCGPRPRYHFALAFLPKKNEVNTRQPAA
jgi:hypothetical protein